MNGIQSSYSTQCFHIVTLNKVGQCREKLSGQRNCAIVLKRIPIIKQEAREHSSHCLSYMTGFPTT